METPHSNLYPPLLVDHKTTSLELTSCLYHRFVCELFPYVRAALSAARALWTASDCCVRGKPRARKRCRHLDRGPVLTTWAAVLRQRSRVLPDVSRTRRTVSQVFFEATVTKTARLTLQIWALSEGRISSKIILFLYRMLQAQQPSHWMCC